MTRLCLAAFAAPRIPFITQTNHLINLPHIPVQAKSQMTTPCNPSLPRACIICTHSVASKAGGGAGSGHKLGGSGSGSSTAAAAAPSDDSPEARRARALAAAEARLKGAAA